MKVWLDAQESWSWDQIRDMQCSEWLWLDMEQPGVHLSDALPATPSRQLTHVWGWADGLAVRVRVDPDLVEPAVAVLRWPKPTDDVPAGIEVLDASVGVHPPWPVGNGRANLAAVPGLNAPPENMLLRTLTVPLRRGGSHGDELFEVAFLTRQPRPINAALHS